MLSIHASHVDHYAYKAVQGKQPTIGCNGQGKAFLNEMWYQYVAFFLVGPTQFTHIQAMLLAT
jgi:hypothetical protein